MEQSGLSTEKKRDIPVGNYITKSSWKGIKGDGEWARDSNRVTQQKVGTCRGFEGSATHTTARQYWDWSPAGDKTDEGDQHVLYFGLQDMFDGGREQTLGRDWHRLERRSMIKG